MPTFGFEMEVQVNAEPLAAALAARRLLPDDTLHAYHCGCPTCDFYSSWLLRAQTDSSCAGEFITTILNSDEMEVARNLMTDLQDAAVEADAEPGYSAGFHVHVGWGDMRPTSTILGEFLWQFAEWEEVLMDIAAGRFLSIRDGMNTTVNSCHVQRWNRDHGLRQPNLLALRRRLAYSEDDMAGEYHRLYTRHHDTDRHSNLNVRSRHSTFEYRLWNSTRSAWRMELWCLLSLAFMDPRLVPVLRQATATQDPTVPMLIDILGSNRHADAARLLNRQYNYMAARPLTTTEPAFTLAS